MNVKFVQLLAQKSWTFNIMAKLIFTLFNCISTSNVFTFIFCFHFMYKEKLFSFLCTFFMYCKKSCNGSDKCFIYPSILSLTMIRNVGSGKTREGMHTSILCSAILQPVCVEGFPDPCDPKAQ